MLFTIYPIVFQQQRGWNAGVGQLPLIGSMIGAAIGAATVFAFSRHDQKRAQSGYRGTPEDRLVIGMIGGVGFAITMFWFAWSANFNSIHWIVPTTAGVFLSTSILLIFVSFLNYITDSYLMHAASAMAANTVARSATAASAPLFTEQMFNSLGIGGAGSLIGGVATLLAVIPFAFYKYGAQIRVKSKFAPTRSTQPQTRRAPEEEKPDDGEGPSSPASSNSSDTAGSALSRLDKSSSRGEDDEADLAHDVPQNAIGQPRTENTHFGHEDV
ncbi:hypothetical protein R6Q59_010025 [Mikania micrantha]